MVDQVLSQDEVEAMLKASHPKNDDLDKVMNHNGDTTVDKLQQYSQALANINDLVRNEIEVNIASFFRSKLFVKSVAAEMTTAGECFKEEHNHIYAVYRAMPYECYGIVSLDFILLHQAINLMYGGKIQKEDTVLETPGRIGMIIADKLFDLLLSSFTKACQEFGAVNYEILKTTPSLNLAFNYGLSSDDPVYVIEYSIMLDEIECRIKYAITDDFLAKFVPVKQENKHREKDFWRDIIKTQLSDSIVSVMVTLPDVNLKVNEVFNLKEGDTIPISDPTLVYVCLNNLKLFRAVAGQSNSKLVVKIVNQI